MGYIAAARLRFGDRFIEPGEPVPHDDPQRNYQQLLRTGQIVVHAEPKQEARGPRGAISPERAPRSQRKAKAEATKADASDE